jgi:hypothetical protein
MFASNQATQVANDLVQYAAAMGPLKTMDPTSSGFSDQVTAWQTAQATLASDLGEYISTISTLSAVEVTWLGVTQTAGQLASRLFAITDSSTAPSLSDADAETMAAAFAQASTAYAAGGN